MRPETGLKVLRDVAGEPRATPAGEGALSAVDVSNFRASTAAPSTSSSTTPRKIALPLGHVSKVTDHYIEVRWTGDGNRAEKIQTRDDGTFGLRVLASGKMI